VTLILRKQGGRAWIALCGSGEDTRLDIVNRVLLLQVAYNAGNFLTR